jgi:hypothetical protein
MFHSGDGTPEDREHLESCLGCARKYRELQNDMDTLLTTLRRPPVAIAARRAPGNLTTSPRFRWALAASMMIAAFAGGRFSSLTSAKNSSVSVIDQKSRPTQIVMADNADTNAPASYGLFIDDLIASGSSDDANEQDPDSHIDSDSDAF